VTPVSVRSNIPNPANPPPAGSLTSSRSYILDIMFTTPEIDKRKHIHKQANGYFLGTSPGGAGRMKAGHRGEMLEGGGGEEADWA
jgi:hypothetical protein